MAADGMVLTNHDHQTRVGILTGKAIFRGETKAIGPSVAHQCRVNVAVTIRAASGLPTLAAGGASMLSSPAAADCILTAPADVQAVSQRSRLGCSEPKPKVLQPQTRLVLSKAALLRLWLVVRLFQSASSGRQRRRVGKIFKMKDLFHYAAVAFRF